LASSTSVGDSESHALALIRCSDLTTTDGIVVRVYSVIAGERVEQKVRNSANVLAVVVSDTTSAT
jgi:hypothetical protein